MPKQVLSIGNCGYDFSTLSAALQKNYQVELQSVNTAKEATKAVKEAQYDLIVVNRLFDVNGESGIELIKKLKPTVKTPMMLISNYPEYQQEAVAAGAVPGFGKTQVGKPALLEVVGEFLK